MARLRERLDEEFGKAHNKDALLWCPTYALLPRSGIAAERPEARQSREWQATCHFAEPSPPPLASSSKQVNVYLANQLP